MVELVEWDRNSLSVLDELALVHRPHRGKDGESQRVLEFARGCEAGLQHFHYECAADAQPESDHQRHHEGTISVGKTLTAESSRHDDPGVARPKCRLLVRDFGLLQKVLEQALIHRRRSFQFTQSYGGVII